ncbi:divergent polysaccharide deacetylase family protein [Pelagibacterium lacus]|uniref:Divergent polysaccharide deacetylase family protein n=1 Tax=Pelagibacterium lacus TaxID=2282655 RepID=A0A369W4H0_9HYPH|nr:divergent polysaccharide deacetylase family protein [Pelagibacterium lacus]RDE09594.1 divergent polysaccharide deacetylase family protein [Pelagibacterium lacus]
MTGELDAPLGRKRRARAASRAAHIPWGRLGAGLFILLALGIGGWVVFVDDPLGGRPVAETPINTQGPANAIADDLATPPPPETRQPVTLTPLEAPGGPSIITLGDMAAAADPAASDADPRADLTERTSNGPLPRVGADGTRPFDAYARPSVTPASAGGRKLIGIVVSGLGLSESSTRDAIQSLPGTMTLAFAPYGRNLEQLTREARADGHEIMLEIPLEPFDYPQNDPGPHTLLVEQPPRDNLEKLYWLMTRMGGYTGVLNHMGARFTASAADFSPVMEELGLRGLSYLDDGSSNRSVAPQLARQNAVPYARVDRPLDTNPSRTAILAALEDIRATADAEGRAIGIVSALPVSIRTLAEWANGLDENTYLLVPISALSTTQG